MGTGLLKSIAWVVRNIPVNRRKEMFIEWAANLNNKPDFSFFSRQLGLRWSAKGFPDLLTRHMLFEGMYQQEVLAALGALIHPGDTIIDAGGHHGLMAIVASRTTGLQGLVVSFEPNPHARAQLLENCALNGVKNVRLEPLALSDRQGSLKFYIQKGRVSWNSSLFPDFASQNGRDETEEIEVAVTTIDNYVEANGLAPALIKIDVEGSEFLILRGAMKTIAKYTPILSMEFNPESAQAAHTTIAENRKFLEDLGYRLRVLRPSPMGFYRFTNQEAFSEEKHTAHNLCNVICIPARSTA